MDGSGGLDPADQGSRPQEPGARPTSGARSTPGASPTSGVSRTPGARPTPGASRTPGARPTSGASPISGASRTPGSGRVAAGSGHLAARGGRRVSGPDADDTGCNILHVDMDAFYASVE